MNHKDLILKALEKPEIQDLMNNEEFVFAETQARFKEFLQFEIDNETLDGISEKIKSLKADKTNKKMKWTRKCLELYDNDTAEKNFLNLLFEIIWRIDTRGHKANDEWTNNNPQIAAAFVRSTEWTNNLIKFKRNRELSQISQSVKNAMLYLNNPENNLTMLSNNMRKRMASLLLEDGDSDDLIPTMKNLGIVAKNPLNNGHLYNCIFHTFSELWKVTEVTGLLRAEVDEIIKTETKMKDNGLGEDVLRMVKTRIGQGKFRDSLLRLYKGCQLCGISEEKLLRASHIVSWADSTAEEKVDIDNGMLLCCNHDALFDKHLIAFQDDGKLLVSDKITTRSRKILGIVNEKQIDLTEESQKYFEKHRAKFFDNSSL